MNDREAVRHMLANSKVLLLDFDGPVCSVFLNVPASVVAEQLRDLLIEGGHTDLPHDVRETADPFDVLRYSAELGPDKARYVEAAFRAHEVEAVQLTRPTSGAHELIRRWKATGRPLAIVSNNSAAAVQVYLARFDLAELIDYVSARTTPDLALLKPAPHLITSAVQSLAVSPAGAVLLGDSTTDVEAAHAAGARSIGYANRPDKRPKFADVGADAITESIVETANLI